MQGSHQKDRHLQGQASSELKVTMEYNIDAVKYDAYTLCIFTRFNSQRRLQFMS